MSTQICLYCKETLKGRSDKKFCNVQCKSDYHNHAECFFQLKSIPVFQFKSIPFDLKDKGIPLLIGVPQSGEEPGNDFL